MPISKERDGSQSKTNSSEEIEDLAILRQSLKSNSGAGEEVNYVLINHDSDEDKQPTEQTVPKCKPCFKLKNFDEVMRLKDLENL